MTEKQTTQVLKINLNWDHRDVVTVYGRSRGECIALLSDWITNNVIEPVARAADPDYDALPVPCIFHPGEGSGRPDAWITFNAFDNRQCKIYRETVGKAVADNLLTTYTGEDGIAAFGAFVKLLGQWEEIPAPLGDLPPWLVIARNVVIDTDAWTRQRAAAEYKDAAHTDQALREARSAAQAKAQEAEEALADMVKKMDKWPEVEERTAAAPGPLPVESLPLAEGGDPFSNWPYMPKAPYELRPGPEAPAAQEEPRLHRIGSGSFMVYPPTGFTAVFVAASVGLKAAGFGLTAYEAILDLLNNAEDNLMLRIGAIDEEEEFEEACEEVKQVRDQKAAVMRTKAVFTAAAPEPKPRAVPDGRPVHYLYIGRRGSDHAWVKVDPEYQNTGDPLVEGHDSRFYFRGDRNVVPGAQIGQIYTFHLSNGGDNIQRAPHVFNGLWRNEGDLLSWKYREGVTTGN